MCCVTSSKMALYFLLMTCMAGSAVATLPSFIKTCSMQTPNMSACILNRIGTMRPHLVEGIPELDVPALEPLHIPEIVLANTSNFKAIAQSVRLHNFSTFDVKTLECELGKGKLYIIVGFKIINLESDYDVWTKLGQSVIAEKGPINIIAKGVEAKVEMDIEKVTHKSKDYIYFPTMTTKLTIDDYDTQFTPSKGDDDALAAGINAILTSNKEDVLKAVIPNIEKTICDVVLNLANKICRHIPRDELFPEHE